MKSRWLILFVLNLSLIFFCVNSWSGTPGSQKWSFEIGDTASSPAIGSDGTIYVGGSGSKFYAINPDGTEKWVFITPSYVDGSPGINAEGTIFIQSVGGYVDGYLHAIDPDGTEKWKFRTSVSFDESASCPSFAKDGTIYVGSTKYLWAIYPDGLNGYVNIQDRCTNGPYTSSPSIGPDGTVYIGSCGPFQGGVHSVGINWWHFKNAGEVRSSPAIGSDGTIYVGSEDGGFYAINPDGSQKWVVDTNTIYSSPVIGIDGTIYIQASGGGLYAINPDGTEKWHNHLLGTIAAASTAAIGDNGTIYVQGCQFVGSTSRGGLFAFNPDGTEKWLFKPSSPDPCFASGISSPAIGTDGTIYSVMDDKLYAIHSDSDGLAKSPWPMFNHDAKHTGRYEALPKGPKALPFLLPLLLDRH